MGARMIKIMSLFQNQLVFVIAAVIAVVAIVLFFGMQILKKNAGDKDKPWPLGVNANFLTAAEQSFFGVLKQTVGSRYQICPKVNLKDVLFIRKGTNNSLQQTIFNKISRKHLDFVLLDPQALIPVMAVELDDASHRSASAIKRDGDKNRALNDAGLKIVRIPAKRSYTMEDLKEIFTVEQQNNTGERLEEADTIQNSSHVEDIVHNDMTGNNGSNSKEIEAGSIVNIEKTEITIEASTETISAEPSESTPEAIPLCPKCNVEMIKRQASRGSNVGQQFWGCPNFPKCREIIPIRSETK